jgi:hypothetical protein
MRQQEDVFHESQMSMWPGIDANTQATEKETLPPKAGARSPGMANRAAPPRQATTANADNG